MLPLHKALSSLMLVSICACDGAATSDDQLRDAPISHTSLSVSAQASQFDDPVSDSYEGPPPATISVNDQAGTSSASATASENQVSFDITVVDSGIHLARANAHSENEIDASLYIGQITVRVRADVYVDSNDEPGVFEQSMGTASGWIEVENGDTLIRRDGEAESINGSYEHYATAEGFFAGLPENGGTRYIDIPISVDPDDPILDLRMAVSGSGLSLNSPGARSTMSLTVVDILETLYNACGGFANVECPDGYFCQHQNKGGSSAGNCVPAPVGK